MMISGHRESLAVVVAYADRVWRKWYGRSIETRLVIVIGKWTVIIAHG